ncbi:AAA family ATPase [Burkholderia cenocepacia]|uniref:AAA family ATPase n=1 Tax=Burkholderia cenocepacia TaxID=95486 RepID=UPI00076110B6|nr:AAA family ATPase [Burkholderia cenocepacia]KWU24782.1 hypothetical protein AS149_32060 [Burkholderia cenocepacia]
MADASAAAPCEHHDGSESTARRKLKVINLFGAPGMGKSSVASGLFWLMKSHHMSVELVSEYAKYLVLSGRSWQLTEEQTYLFAKQHHKQLIIERNNYEFAVTDSPLSLSEFYAPKGFYESFGGLVDEASARFENINFFVSRDLSAGAHFENRGREHDREQSLEVEERMRAFLERKGLTYTELQIRSDLLAPWEVLKSMGFSNLLKPRFADMGC